MANDNCQCGSSVAVWYNSDCQSRVAPERAVMSTALTGTQYGQAQGQVLMNTSKSTYVYFISVGSGPIKIGISDDPPQRLNTLQTAHYRKLYLLYTLECVTREEAFQLETAFHRWYADVQLINEWFDITPSQIEADIRLLETLAKSAVHYAAHTSSAMITKIEERAQKRMANATGQGYTKRTDARVIVRSYLEEHPDAVAIPVRELAALIGVGKTTVAEVIADIRAGGKTLADDNQ